MRRSSVWVGSPLLQETRGNRPITMSKGYSKHFRTTVFWLYHQLESWHFLPFSCLYREKISSVHSNGAVRSLLGVSSPTAYYTGSVLLLTKLCSKPHPQFFQYSWPFLFMGSGFFELYSISMVSLSNLEIIYSIREDTFFSMVSLSNLEIFFTA